MTTEAYEVAEVDQGHEETDPCGGCGCGWYGTADEAADIGDCSLTPGDSSPVGRCPKCKSLVYLDRPKDRAQDRATDLLKALRAFTVCGQASEGAHFHEDYNEACAVAADLIAAIEATEEPAEGDEDDEEEDAA